jgi:hypothetical protein
VTFSDDEKNYLDARFGEVLNRIKTLEEQGRVQTAALVQHVASSSAIFDRLTSDAAQHEVMLRGEDGRDGLVRDVDDAKRDIRIARGIAIFTAGALVTLAAATLPHYLK